MRRSVLLAVPLLMTGPAAHATGCEPVTDPAHDERLLTAVPIDAPSLDILSAELVVGTDVVGIVRPRDLAGGPGPYAGSIWHLDFTVSGTTYELSAQADPDGTDFYVSRLGGPWGGTREPIGTATGTVDVAAGEVRIVAARSVFGSALAAGTLVEDVRAAGYGGLHPAPASTLVDEAGPGDDCVVQ